MEIWKAAVLGIVQGLTEFLPVSSSGHILLFERILRVDTAGADMFLGIMLHAGTLISVLFVYFSKIAALFREDRKKLLYLLLATLPAALVGVLLGDLVDRIFFGGKYLWLFFALTAVLLLLASRRLRRGYPLRPLDAKRSFLIGGAQALAVLPGLSRSGTTLAACVFAGMEREEAADFSFLMSIPIIGGAVLTEIFKAFMNESYVTAVSWQALAVGCALSAIFGLVAVKLVLRFMKRGSFVGFSVYLFLLAAFLFANNWLYIL